jgi:hypothetical protein
MFVAKQIDNIADTLKEILSELKKNSGSVEDA